MEFALSAPAALELIGQARDVTLILILSDINMPAMSGLELLQNVVGHEGSRRFLDFVNVALGNFRFLPLGIGEDHLQERDPKEPDRHEAARPDESQRSAPPHSMS